MAADALREALKLAQRRPTFVATADADGLPHLACAGLLAEGPLGCVLVTEWFCPGTLENVTANPRVALVVWDEAADAGYQLLGTVEGLEETAVLDGHGAPAEGADVPQVRQRMVVRVEAVLDFCQAPHTDVAEQGPGPV